MQLAELLAVDVQRVEQLAVDVELRLAPGAVADAHGLRVAPAGEVWQLALAEVVLAADPVHDLQRGASAGRARHEGDELLRLVAAAADVERLQRQARIADPREAVVPVALPAHRLGQRRRRRGDDRARRSIGQAFEDTRAESDELAVRPCVDVVVGLPGAPALDRVRDPRGDLLGRGRRRRLVSLRRDPAQREADALARGDGKRRLHRHVLDRDGDACTDADAVRAAEGAAAVVLHPEERSDESVLGAR